MTCSPCHGYYWLQYGHETLDPGSSTLWFAGKQMINEKPLSEYLGSLHVCCMCAPSSVPLVARTVMPGCMNAAGYGV
eukprot:1153286-Pelagomonas_calceolata.AAC.3